MVKDRMMRGLKEMRRALIYISINDEADRNGNSIPHPTLPYLLDARVVIVDLNGDRV